MSAEPVKLGGSVNNEHAMHIRALFEKYYDNKIAVIALEQKGNYGKIVQVSAKVNLKGMNRRTLRFYSYDAKTGKFIPVTPPPRYYIDEKGFLNFDTFVAGDIIITDSALLRKV